jgi:hypothetical protein
MLGRQRRHGDQQENQRAHAAIGSPGRDQLIRSTAACTRMIVSLKADTVTRQL